ncbi:questin oxidase family protein [Roseateles cellulosilyticus]|uniref:Questin oxidase family protein n=1 Tax=Pelomonas cellulosilytica TaxID=2906762 RepID=A0ABS8Y315_9BURK|nr:questin oxidase family protein [Pelomonas sp. P8]MCE4557474.1 questin oxidase family protein [Pelomonas sp. P8]
MSPETATFTPATPAQLHHLLDAGRAWSATYLERMSNHLPMAQQALLELGASTGRLQAFTEAEESHLEPQAVAWPARSDASRDLGRPDRDAAWRSHFAGRIADVGADAALREALAVLLPGAGAIAFHGLIRTGHAVLAGHDGELAAGLAHWASHFTPLAVADGAPLALAGWLQALRSLLRPAYPVGSFIADRMQAWGGTPGFAAVAGRLQTGPDSLRDLALLAARTYAASGNFTVLHLLTASHAMSVLQPWWPTSELPHGFSVAAAAGLLASGATPSFALGNSPSRPWPALIAAACAHNDLHVIKLTHAAWRLDRQWPDPAWRSAVERAIPV